VACLLLHRFISYIISLLINAVRYEEVLLPPPGRLKPAPHPRERGHPRQKGKYSISHAELTALRKLHGEKVIGQVKVDDAVLGMRGLPVMFYDGSSLDPISGITFRGHSIPEFCSKAQKAPGGVEPLPETMFFLLATGRYPTQEEFDSLSTEWRHRGDLSKQDVNFITSLPKDFHPMTLLSMSLLNQQVHSKFFKAYQSGTNKAKYWEYYF